MCWERLWPDGVCGTQFALQMLITGGGGTISWTLSLLWFLPFNWTCVESPLNRRLSLWNRTLKTALQKADIDPPILNLTVHIFNPLIKKLYTRIIPSPNWNIMIKHYKTKTKHFSFLMLSFQLTFGI